MKYRNKREAAEAWVREFDAIDSDMVAELMEYNPSDWHEVTEVCNGTKARRCNYGKHNHV